MKKMLIVILMLVIGSIALADTNKQEFSFDMDWMTQYVWRGQLGTDDIVMQPTLSTSIKDFTFAVSGNLNTTSDEYEWDFTELDYIVDYTKLFPDMENLSYSFGAIYYDFLDTPVSNTIEVYTGLQLDTFLKPNITLYRDIVEANANYLSFGIKHDFNMVKTSASVGWGDNDYNKFYWNKDVDGFNDLSISASVPFKVKNVTIAPSVTYITLLDKEMRSSTAFGDDSDYLVFGIKLKFKF